MENINEQNIVDEIKSVLQSEYYVQQELNDEQIKEVIKNELTRIIKEKNYNIMKLQFQ